MTHVRLAQLQTVLVIASALLGALLAGTAHAELRRFAIVVGNNAGASDRPPLRYAEDDAARMARALGEVGEIQPADLMLLQGRSAADVQQAIARMQQRIQQVRTIPGTRTFLLFYFSGHGDGEALELGHEPLPFAQLEALLKGTGAETRVAIIDACQSGSAILKKGGKPSAPFAIHVSHEQAVSGDVFITSTAANEAALESSELKGSFFTSHLISGLRGAADSSGDQRVTLNELYRYTYQRTVETTAVTSAGTQHPSFKLDLSGQGELVLSTLSRAAARLELPKDADRVVITDAQRGQVVAEVEGDSPRTLALAPGRYEVRSVRHGRAFASHVVLAEGARHVLDQLAFKGDPEPVVSAPAPAPRPSNVSQDGVLRVCILGFKNLTGDPKLDYLGDALVEAIHTDFGSNKGVRLLERGQIDVPIEEIDFGEGKYVDPKTRAVLGRLQGAQIAVVGSYQRFGRTTRLNGRFVNVETGEVLKALKVDRPSSDLLGLQDAVAARIREALPALQTRVRR